MSQVDNPNSVMYVSPVLRAARRLVYEKCRTSDKSFIALKNIAHIEMGQSPNGQDCSSEPQGEPLLNGPTEFGHEYPTPVQWTTAGKKFATKGDLLFCVRGATAGRTNWADQKYAIGRGLAAVHGRQKSGDTAFVYHMLRDRRDVLAAEARGSTFMNMGKQLLHTLPMPSIDFTLQEILGQFLDSVENKTFQFDAWSKKLSPTSFSDIPRIVARIEELAAKVEEARELRSQTQKHLQSFVSSFHLHLASDRNRTLDQILQLDEDRQEVIFGHEYPQVGVRGFGGGLFFRETLDATQTTYKAFNRLYEGAIVLSQVKGWEGAIAGCPDNLVGKYVSPEYRTFRCIEGEALPAYMATLVTSPWFWTQLKNLTRGMGGRRERTRPEKFLTMKIPMPNVIQGLYRILCKRSIIYVHQEIAPWPARKKNRTALMTY
ncbi:MAG: hypothetical protein AAF821_17285 [Cyanobacteria bacterium P01_D01_bin.156]